MVFYQEKAHQKNPRHPQGDQNLRLEIAPKGGGKSSPGLYADSGAIIRELGWTPRYMDLKAIVETAWRWHEQGLPGKKHCNLRKPG